MTKTSKKLFRAWRKENAGCMRGLISLFEFRRGRRTQKLLSSKRRESASNLGITKARNKVDLPSNLEEYNGDIQNVINLSDTESDEAALANPCISSIATLMDKEMSGPHHSRSEFNSKIKWIKAELETGATPDNNHRDAIKNATLSSKKLNGSSNSISQPSDHPDISTILSSDFSTFMLDYCTNFLELKENQVDYKNKAGKPCKPHKNQLLGEHLGTEAFQKQNDHYFFRKREKLTTVYQSDVSEDSESRDRIVVLKPTHVRNRSLSNMIAPIGSISSHCGLPDKERRERLSSHFSLNEIRKRFRDVIGSSRKEKHAIAMDGVLHKIPYGKQLMTGTENGGGKRLDAEEKNGFSNTSRKKLSKNYAPRVLYTEASFCDEARKHLMDFLRIGSESEPLPLNHISNSLGKVLSFPGFNLSPRPSPAREKSEVLQKNKSLLLCSPNEEDDPEVLDVVGEEDGFPEADEDPKFKTEITEIVKIGEVSQLEARSISISDEDDLASEAFKEEGSSMLLEPEQSEARFGSSTPSTPTISKLSEVQESKEMECTMDDADRPSPVSVLEPFFEEVHDPASISSWILKASNTETQSQPRESQIDSSAPASHSTEVEEDLISCAEFNEALLFDELEESYSTCIDNPKLLFDLIDEVLMEIKDRHFGFISRVPFIKPTILPIHKHEYFIKEACRRIEWNLDVRFPNTLEQAVRKDLDGTVWIDLRFGSEYTVSMIGDSILDYLFEELALELWN